MNIGIKATPRKEKEIQKEILNYLKRAGYLAERLPLAGMLLSSGRMAKNNMSGFPDILAVCRYKRGVLLGIEVKRPGGTLQENQKEWKERLEKAGCIYIVATSVKQLIMELAVKDCK